MKTTYLYVKQHKKTGLKYFGKTQNKKPYSYKGSGRYWQRHLKKHGTDIETLWVLPFENKDEIVEYALTFSKENDVVKSTEWANEKMENGLDGGSDKGRKVNFKPMPEERKKSYSDRMKSNNPMHDPVARANHATAMASEKTKKRKSKAKQGNTNVRGKSWYNDGVTCKMFVTPPKGWVKGRLNPHWNHKRKHNG